VVTGGVLLGSMATNFSLGHWTRLTGHVSGATVR